MQQQQEFEFACIWTNSVCQAYCTDSYVLLFRQSYFRHQLFAWICKVHVIFPSPTPPRPIPFWSPANDNDCGYIHIYIYIYIYIRIYPVKTNVRCAFGTRLYCLSPGLLSACAQEPCGEQGYCAQVHNCVVHVTSRTRAFVILCPSICLFICLSV